MASAVDQTKPNARLRDRVAIVTGAGRGIGRAIAKALADEGALVVAASRTLSEVEETAAILNVGGRHAVAVAVDVSKWHSVQSMVDHTLREWGRVDILVNNAGVQGPIGSMVENDAAEWMRTIEINLLGAFHCSKAVLPGMIERRRGKIINLSGGGATAPRPHFSAYAVSKAAVVRLTETLAQEVQQYNIQVNAIAPGAINTRMLDQVLAAGPVAGDAALAEARRQLETGGTPTDLAASLVVFLASGESDRLTGRLISALHDGWQSWDAGGIAEIMAAPWFTLRRVDPFTIGPLAKGLGKASE